MSSRTKSTVKMLCVKSGIINDELPKEAQKLLETYNDPNVSPEQKKVAEVELDKAIKKLEERVTTRRLNEARSAGTEPSVP